MAPKYQQAKRNAPKTPHKGPPKRGSKSGVGFGVDPNRAVLPIDGFKAGKRKT